MGEIGFVVFLWLVLCVVVAVVANSRGHSGLTYFLISLLLSPLIGLILAVAMQPNKKEVEAAQIRSGELKTCPFCAETIQAKAIVCRYCGRDLPAAIDRQDALPENELWRDEVGILTTRHVRVKSAVYPLQSITSLDVITTGGSWHVLFVLTDGTVQRLGHFSSQSAARELWDLIENARMALLTWKPEPAPSLAPMPDAGASASVAGPV